MVTNSKEDAYLSPLPPPREKNYTKYYVVYKMEYEDTGILEWEVKMTIFKYSQDQKFF